MREILINGERINDQSDCYVIAEIGHNHQGSLETAKKMVQTAKECGANAVKLQKRDNKTLFTSEIYNSPYDNVNSYGATYGEHREALEFDKTEYSELIDYAKKLNIDLFATAFDFKSADFLANLDMPAFKIASGDLNNTPLLKHVAQFGKPIILSTGGGTLDDVKRAYDTIMPINKNLCILQCTAAYPIQNYEDMNLQIISTYRKTFPDIVIGLSDHESGIAMALVAYMLGARVVEKHFTLNRAWRGTDHSFSLSPGGLQKLARNLKRAHAALGDGEKKMLPCEEKPLFKMSKKIVAAKNLPEGHILQYEDLALKSPADRIPPYHSEKIIGKVLLTDIKEEENMTWENLK